MRRASGLTFLLLLFVLSLSSCLPDSFKKFKEDPPKEPIASGGGDSAPPPPAAPPPATCIANTPTGGACTPPTQISYDEAEFGFDTANPVQVDLKLLLEGAVPNTVDFTAFSVQFLNLNLTPRADQAAELVTFNNAGFSFSASNGGITGTAGGLYPPTILRVTATHQGIDPVTFLPRVEVVTTDLKLSAGTKINEFGYPQLYNSLVVLELDQVSDAEQFFGATHVVGNDGAVGRLVYVDDVKGELHVFLEPNNLPLQDAQPVPEPFKSGNNLDTGVSFISTKATIASTLTESDQTTITLAFDNNNGFGVIPLPRDADANPITPDTGGFIPRIEPSPSVAEAALMEFSITPALPTGFVFDTVTGQITINPALTPTATLLPPTIYTITLRDPSGGVTSAKIKLSRVNQPGATPATKTNPKSPVDLIIPQNVGQRLVLKAATITAFDNTLIGQNIMSKDGDVAQVGFVDTKTQSIFVTVVSGFFDTDDEIDNTPTYFGTETTITDIEYAYATNHGLQQNLNPIRVVPLFRDFTNSTSTNLVSVASIDPAEKQDFEYVLTQSFPSTTNFQSDALGFTQNLNGAIGEKGIYQLLAESPSIESLSFELTANNQANTNLLQRTFKIRVEKRPEDLSYTKQVLLTLNTNSHFKEGHRVSTPIKAPASKSTIGTVARLIGNDKILVNVIDGTFEDNDSLDNIFKFSVEKARVIDIDPNIPNEGVQPVSAILTMAAGTFVNGANGSFTTVTDGVRGTLQHQDGTTLYVKALDGARFRTGDLIADNGATNRAITNVTANVVSMVLSEAGDFFIAGQDFVSNDVTPANDVGVVLEVDGAAERVTIVTNKGTYEDGETVDRVNPFGSNHRFSIDNITGNPPMPTITASTVRSENHFELFRDNSTSIEANIRVGDNLIYTVSPTLPVGLSLNEDTGLITGSPEDASAKTSYTVTAHNAIDKTSFTFSIKVHNQFSITDQTEAVSYNMHRAGSNNATTACQLNQDQIDAGTVLDPTNPGDTNDQNVIYRDINCLLEVGELDLDQLGLKLEANVSKGICNFFRFRPYAFWNFAPIQTTSRVFRQHNGPSNCFPGGDANPDGDPVCQGDHSRLTEGAPNCDEGSYTVRTFEWEENPGCNLLSVSDETFECGGDVDACIDGPVRHIGLSGVDEGFRAAIYNTEFGFGPDNKITWDMPNVTVSGGSNTFYANYTAANGARTMDQGGANPSPADFFNSNTGAWARYGSMTDDLLETTVDSTFSALAFDPFRGLGAQTNPFYTFECLDEAQDLIARVRLQVREWDRTFTPIDDPSDNAFLGLNDIFHQGRLRYAHTIPTIPLATDRMAVGALMDSGTAVDNFGDGFNDRFDWDDRLIRATVNASPELGTGGTFPGANDSLMGDTSTRGRQAINDNTVTYTTIETRAPTAQRERGTGTIGTIRNCAATTDVSAAPLATAISRPNDNAACFHFVSSNPGEFAGVSVGDTIAIVNGVGYPVEYYLVAAIGTEGGNDAITLNSDPVDTTPGGLAAPFTYDIVKSYPFPRVINATQ